MTTSIIQSSNQSENQSSPFDGIRHYDENGIEFWKARELQKMMGYTKWQMFGNAIEQGLENLESAVGDISSHALLLEVTLKFQKTIDYKLSRIACYHIALACDSRGKPNVKAAKHYFAVKTREAELVIPLQNDRIRELELENENLKLRTGLVDLTNTIVGLHGEALGLTIAGLNIGQIIEIKIPVTEVLNPATGKCDEFLDAKQLASEVARRSGQKVKNADFIRKVKSANRDDLILPVTRNMTCEYIRAEDLDEAIDVVFSQSKQRLLGA